MGKRKPNQPKITPAVKGVSFGVEREYTATDDLWEFTATGDASKGLISTEEGETI